MRLSVIVPARNEVDKLAAQLDALLKQVWDGDWEIIVVDNDSTDGTAALVETYATQSDRIRLVHAKDRADKSYSVMVGIAASDAEALVFCDADDVVAAGWLAAMAKGLSEHEVVTGPNELDLLNPSWLASSRGRSAADADETFCGIFPFARGNNYGVRSTVWQRVGPLMEGYSACEDIEFSLRCWINNIKIVSLPDAVVHYRYRQSARDLWRQGWRYGTHRPMIARMLRDAGRPTPPRFSGWKSWVLLVLTIPRTVTRHGRATWLWVAANRFGQVAGSIRHRIIML